MILNSPSSFSTTLKQEYAISENITKLRKLRNYEKSRIKSNALFIEEWFGRYGGREILLSFPEEQNPHKKTRAFIDSPLQLRKYLEDCRRFNEGCYMTAQPYEKRGRVFGLEKLFFDFDCEQDLEKAWRETKNFAQNLNKYYNIQQ